MKRGILALVGTTSGGLALAAAAERHALRCVQNAGALTVYAGAGIADQVMESGALLLGDIYSLSGATCHAPGDGWGSYLAFTVDDASVEIARAALTGMPIYWTRFEDGFLLWNDLELVAPMLGIGSFDWQFIAGTLAYANLRTERTGLEGVSELLPGSCAKFLAEESAVQTLWTPWKAVSQPDLRPVAELALDLERRFLGCLRGWCGNRSDILLELSGGLDSSIVAAGLSSAQANFSAVTFVSSGADGDERPYAKANRRDDSRLEKSDVGRIEQSRHRFDADAERNKPERHRRGKSSEIADLAGSEAIGRVVRIALRITISDRRHAEGTGMRRHVETIGEQRHRSRDVAGDDLADHHQRGQNDDEQRAPGILVM